MKDDAFATIIRLGPIHTQRQNRLPEASPFGLNGAALAAFGDSPFDLGGEARPLPAKEEGVKLGESTLRCFFVLDSHDKYISRVFAFSAATAYFSDEFCDVLTLLESWLNTQPAAMCQSSLLKKLMMTVTFIFISAMSVNCYMPAKRILCTFCSTSSLANLFGLSIVMILLANLQQLLPRPFGRGESAARRTSSGLPLKAAILATTSQLYAHSICDEVSSWNHQPFPSIKMIFLGLIPLVIINSFKQSRYLY